MAGLKFLTSTNRPNPPKQRQSYDNGGFLSILYGRTPNAFRKWAILWTCEIKESKGHLLCEPSFTTSAPVPSTQNVAPRYSGTDLGGVSLSFAYNALSGLKTPPKSPSPDQLCSSPHNLAPGKPSGHLCAEFGVHPLGCSLLELDHTVCAGVSFLSPEIHHHTL